MGSPARSALTSRRRHVSSISPARGERAAAAGRRAGGAGRDVTAATGAYGRFDVTNLPPYGLIPTPVAKVCELTYFCQDLGIHMTTAGYHIIAKLEAATLPKLN